MMYSVNVIWKEEDKHSEDKHLTIAAHIITEDRTNIYFRWCTCGFIQLAFFADGDDPNTAEPIFTMTEENKSTQRPTYANLLIYFDNVVNKYYEAKKEVDQICQSSTDLPN